MLSLTHVTMVFPIGRRSRAVGGMAAMSSMICTANCSGLALNLTLTPLAGVLILIVNSGLIIELPTF